MKLREALSVINEKKFASGFIEFTENPGARELVALVMNSEEEHVRGLIDTSGNVYVWSANEGDHSNGHESLTQAGIDVTNLHVCPQLRFVGDKYNEFNDFPVKGQYGPIFINVWHNRLNQKPDQEPSEQFQFLLRGLKRIRPEVEQPSATL